MTINRELYQGATEFKSGHASKVLRDFSWFSLTSQVESREITRKDDTNAFFNIFFQLIIH